MLLLKQSKRRDRGPTEVLFVLAYRCLEHVGPRALCAANELGVLRSSGGHERISSSDALFLWRCTAILLKHLDEVDVYVCGPPASDDVVLLLVTTVLD